MTERGAVPDNGIAVEPREAQRPTSLAARTPKAATPGNRESPWVRRRASQACLKGAVAQHPRRLPALHPLIEGRRKNGKDAPASQIIGVAERWLILQVECECERQQRC